ncbi:MAG: hypothetical protein WDN75_13420 [Bacteroidota bacterium]
MLDFCGIVIPEGYKNSSHFSKSFMAWLAALNLSEGAKVSLELKLESLKGIRAQLLIANRHVNKLGKGEQYKESVELLRSIPGIGLLKRNDIFNRIGRY